MEKTQSQSNSPARILFAEGANGMPKVDIETAWSSAEIYLHGAHITRFQRKNEPPLLFMSQSSRFQADTPIRGGIPVIFPWFGSREGLPSHGFARTQTWSAREVVPLGDGRVSLRLSLPDCPPAASYPKFQADYWVTVGPTLIAELIITNLSAQDFTFETCLHTYFTVGEVERISVVGLKGREYLDQCDNFARKTEKNDAIQIAEEVDRSYVNTSDPVEIHDPGMGRRIRIEKWNSLSTVVWNPWIAKSRRLPDFGDEEYLKMVCVESGNIGENEVTLAPGKSASLKVELSSLPL